jgi:hypothetical protein
MKNKVDKLLKQGNEFDFYDNSNGRFGAVSDEYQAWLAIVEDFIVATYGKDSSPFRLYAKFNIDAVNGYLREGFDSQHSIVIAALKACKGIEPRKQVAPTTTDSILQNTFDKFHTITLNLRHRHDNRSTIDVKDEYDVQDLLHALLKLNFGDIRKEEWTPSYAGGSARMDFLLKKEQIVIEVKMTRLGLDDKILGKQLIEDKARYKSHPDCKKLICFTYDPQGKILNPAGLENDLNQDTKDFKVQITIRPEH